MSKLTLLHINIIGIVVALILAATLWFLLIKPKNEDTQTTLASAESTRQAGGTDAKIREQDTKLKQTKAAAVQTQKDWSVYSAKYMPNFPYKPTTNDLILYFFPAVGKGKYGFRDIPTVWGQWLTAWYDAQRNLGVARDPGTEFPIDAFPADPNELTARLQNHLTFPADGKPWPVSVTCKTFDDAMAHLRRFNNMEKHGMPVVNNVALAGQSPELHLTYDLLLYIIPTSAPPAPDPMIGGVGAGGAGGAPGMGMPGMGMPGMPGSGGFPGSGGRPMGMPPGAGGGPPGGFAAPGRPGKGGGAGAD